MPVGHALARVTPTYFKRNRAQAEVLLRTTDPAELATGIIEVDRESGAKHIIGGLETLGIAPSIIFEALIPLSGRLGRSHPTGSARAGAIGLRALHKRHAGNAQYNISPPKPHEESPFVPRQKRLQSPGRHSRRPGPS